MNNEVLMIYDVPEGTYHYDKPFVYYKDGDLYLEHFKVLERDKEMVLRAVREYKRPEKDSNHYYHEDLGITTTNNRENAYQYWFSAFTYQAIGGGLVLWHDIQAMWEQHLARTGEHKCPKCGTKTVMYYRPFCPACGEITFHKGAVNLFELVYKLAHKYGKTDEEKKELKNEYIDAFADYCEEFGNDRPCSIEMPERHNDDDEETKRKLDRLEEMNLTYPFNRHLFWVSW